MRTKINGAQAEGCSPISTAFKAGRDFFKPVKPKTIAKSLAIGNPADGYYALKATAESKGAMDMVTDDEVVEGIKLLGADRRDFCRNGRRRDDRCAPEAGETRHDQEKRRDGRLYHRQWLKDAGGGDRCGRHARSAFSRAWSAFEKTFKMGKTVVVTHD